MFKDIDEYLATLTGAQPGGGVGDTFLVLFEH